MRACFSILLLALCSPCWGQTITISGTHPEPPRLSEIVQSDLIQAPDSVPVGSTIVVQIKGDLPFAVEPKPPGLIRLRDDDGNRVLLIQGAESPGYEISVDYRVVHPTEEEIKSAPWDDRVKFAEWLTKSSQDEFYQDSHTVKVGKGPDPGPEPPEDPQARKVFDAAIANKLPSEECQKVASNMRAVIAQAVATSMTVEQMQQDIKKANSPITGGNPAWDAWEKSLAGIFSVTTKEQAVNAYEKIAEGLGAVK